MNPFRGDGHYRGDVLFINLLQAQAVFPGVGLDFGGGVEVQSRAVQGLGGGLLHLRLGLLHGIGHGQSILFPFPKLPEEPDIEHAHTGGNAPQEDHRYQQQPYKCPMAFWRLGAAGAVNPVIPFVVQRISFVVHGPPP